MIYDANHRYSGHPGRLQHNTTKTKIHGRNRGKQLDKLPGHNHPKDPHELEDIRI